MKTHHYSFRSADSFDVPRSFRTCFTVFRVIVGWWKTGFPIVKNYLWRTTLYSTAAFRVQLNFRGLADGRIDPQLSFLRAFLLLRTSSGAWSEDRFRKNIFLFNQLALNWISISPSTFCNRFRLTCSSAMAKYILIFTFEDLLLLIKTVNLK